eukprot:TRINITY_DN7619_c0_g1_i6.p1 TRINITY_DN7619_c0_g1~~TRINITY_DN7619_c0_g1_i6.p1  ORF type:complete len:369 (+),score=70.60 TRINITY_DN7619_c0_g1_i6:698-1804(+)
MATHTHGASLPSSSPSRSRSRSPSHSRPDSATKYTSSGFSKMLKEENTSPCHVISELLMMAIPLVSFVLRNIKSSLNTKTEGKTSPKSQFHVSPPTKSFQMNCSHILQSQAFQAFLQSTVKLQKVDLSVLNSEERLSFLINLYNLMVIHGYLVAGLLPSSFLDWRYFSRFTFYQVGCESYSLAMVQRLLRGKGEDNCHGYVFQPGDPRLRFMEEKRDPRIHFLLCTHTKTSPKICIVPPTHLSMILKAAAFNYCDREIKISSKHVSLPMIFYWYQSDFESPGFQLMSTTTTISTTENPFFLSEDEENCSDVVPSLTFGGGPKKRVHTYVKWLTPSQRKSVASIDGNFSISYRFDWSPCSMSLEQLGLS